MPKEFAEDLELADVIIGQNIVGYDIPLMGAEYVRKEMPATIMETDKVDSNSTCICSGKLPFSPFLTIQTMGIDLLRHNTDTTSTVWLVPTREPSMMKTGLGPI